MKRKTQTVGVVLALALAAIVVVAVTAERSASKTWRIGYLQSGFPGIQAEFREGMRDLGHVEGRDYVIEYRYAEGGEAQMSATAGELVALKPDIILSGNSDATRALQRLTTTIPIVMAVSADPAEQGFVTSLARPGGNITGMSLLAPQVAAKRLEMLKEVVPGAKRIAVLRPPMNGTVAMFWAPTQEEARKMGLELLELEVDGPSPDFDGLFEIAASKRVDALVAISDAKIGRNARRIAELAARHHLPAIYFDRMLVKAGGLMSYGPSIADLFRRSAAYVDKIMKGANPGDLPIEQPTKFELVLNPAAAKALGLTFPKSLLMRADEAIQ